MKKFYEEPELEIIIISDKDDVLTLSGTINFYDIPDGEEG